MFTYLDFYVFTRSFPRELCRHIYIYIFIYLVAGIVRVRVREYIGGARDRGLLKIPQEDIIGIAHLRSPSLTVIFIMFPGFFVDL
jgi:hypothetical protein